ncbi:hypothetical protein D3C80_1183090 [compost metagenome]
MGEDQARIRWRQWRWQRLWRLPALCEQAGMLPAQLFQLIQRLWATQAQGHLAALVITLVKTFEGLLKGRILQRQGVPVTGVKSP